MAGLTKHPLSFLPRQVTGEQVRGVMVCLPRLVSCCDWYLTSLQEGKENPFTRLPHSPQYRKILEARKKLSVFAQMDRFYKLVSNITRAQGRSRNQGHVSLMPQPSLPNTRSFSWLERRAPERPLSMSIYRCL